MKKLIFILLGLLFLVPTADVLSQTTNDSTSGVSFEKFMSTWESPHVCADATLDKFCQSTNELVIKYKNIKADINFIKIKIAKIPDSGHGVTSLVKITDVNGNRIEKDDALQRVNAIRVRLHSLTTEIVNVTESGADIINKMASGVGNIQKMAPDIKQAKISMDALVFIIKDLTKTIIHNESRIKWLKTSKQA